MRSGFFVLIAGLFLVLIIAPPGAAQLPALANGHYVGELAVSIGDDGRHMTLLRDYSYIDAKGQDWPVPVGTVVDGASIPQIFWSIVGGPFEGKYRNASVIHDWYCDVRTRPWHDVDRMFYEAMLTSGVDETKAKLMYLAVVFGGPRWDDQTIHNSQLAARILTAPSDRPARKRTVNADEPAETRGPIRLTPPDARTRLQGLAKDVRRQNLSLDDIDRLAERDPENVKIIFRN